MKWLRLKIIIALSILLCALMVRENIKSKNEEIEQLVSSVDILNLRIAEANAEIDDLEAELDLKYERDTLEYASQIYQVDPALVWAITSLETGHFTSQLWKEQFNAGGRKDINGEYMTFDSPEHGLFEQVRYIKTQYIDLGMTTPEEMNEKYCPPSDSPSCEYWAEKVNQLMAEYRK